MLFYFFEYGYICVLHSIFFEIFVSKIIHFIHRIVVIVQMKCMTFAFAQKLSVRPSKADSGHRSFERSHLAIRN